MHWYLDVLKKYTVFSGRARRQEYWMFVLFHVIVAVVLLVAETAFGSPGILYALYLLGTILPTLYQDRLGHRRSIVMFLGLWLLTALGFAWYAHRFELHALSGAADRFPTWPLWLIGNLLGFGLGSLGSANRAFVGYLAPPDRTAETFGIWGLIWKLSAITTFPFAWVKDTVGTSAALLVLAGFLSIGLVLTLLIDERRGFAATRRDDTG